MNEEYSQRQVINQKTKTNVSFASYESMIEMPFTEQSSQIELPIVEIQELKEVLNKNDISQIITLKNIHEQKENIYLNVYNKLNSYRIIATIIYAFLGFFQMPYWCFCKQGYTENCQGTQDYTFMYPLSNIPFFSQINFFIIEACLLIFLVANKIIFYKYIQTKEEQKLLLFISITASIIIVYDIFYLYQKIHLLLNEFLRPVFLILFYHFLQQTAIFLFKVLYNSWAAYAIFTFVWIFFSFLGKCLFKDWKSYNNHFKNLPRSLFSIFALQTTNNYPNIEDHYYDVNRSTSAFFIAYLFINYFLMQNVILGIIYMNYKHQLKELSHKYENKVGNTNEIHDHDKYIKRKLTKIRIKHSNKLRQFVKNYLSSALVDALLTLFSTFCTLFIFMYDDINLISDNNYIFYGSILFIATIIIFDSSLRIIYYGKKLRNIIAYKAYFIFEFFEFLSCLMLAIPILLAYTINFQISIFYLNFVLLLRIFRFFRFMTRIRSIKIILYSLKNIIPYCYDNIIIIFFIYYWFVTIGSILFGGHFKIQNEQIYAKRGYPKSYTFNNYNDVANGFLMIFILMVDDDWQGIVNSYTVVMKSWWYRVYFIAFFYIGLLFCIYFIIAFIIDWIVSTWEILLTQNAENANIKQHDTNQGNYFLLQETNKIN